MSTKPILYSNQSMMFKGKKLNVRTEDNMFLSKKTVLLGVGL